MKRGRVFTGLGALALLGIMLAVSYLLARPRGSGEALSASAPPAASTPAQASSRLTPGQAQQAIGGDLEKVLAALGAHNLRELATYVHPVKGLRFSPYIDIDPKHSVVLRAPEVAAAESDRRQRRWGSDDASGEPITGTFNEYAQRFIFDHDFARAPERSFNEFGKRSTTRPNVWEVYPHAIVVELHVPGSKPESEGMDWASLLLIFEKHDGRWYLSALVHDRWSV